MTDQVYDAFVSYSHAADDLLASRLQAGLQRFAKPWWQRRAVRTHPFAALAALAGDEGFACHHVGTLPTAKGYGRFPLYALQRRNADDR